jgi:hypothetical protein
MVDSFGFMCWQSSSRPDPPTSILLLLRTSIIFYFQVRNIR